MWKEGSIRIGRSIFHYWMKVYDNPSEFGIKRGRVSKLTLKRNGETVYQYDRGLDIPEVDMDTKLAVRLLLKEIDG